MDCLELAKGMPKKKLMLSAKFAEIRRDKFEGNCVFDLWGNNNSLGSAEIGLNRKEQIA